MQALLAHARAEPADVRVWIVYVRNSGDQEAARSAMRERLPDAPIEVVVAPVCRPGWLIEVEGMAIVPAQNPHLPAF